jgi:thiol-disulfide isomerase/thioredoxin
VSRALALGCALGLLPVLAGCARSSSAVEFQPITYDNWTRELASLQGQIVVVDIWATWCSPCLQRFPYMVALYHKYKDRGVTFVSLSVDNREDRAAAEAARAFLVKQHATFPNYLLDENILEAFEKLDLVAVPAVFVYDRSGRQRYKLTGDDPSQQFTEADVEAAVMALLAE